MLACNSDGSPQSQHSSPSIDTVVIGESHESVATLGEAFAAADLVALATLVEVEPAFLLSRDESYATEQLEQENVGLVFRLDEVYKSDDATAGSVTVSWPGYQRRDGERVGRLTFEGHNVDPLAAEGEQFLVFLVGIDVEQSEQRVLMFGALDANAQVTADGVLIPFVDGVLTDSPTPARLEALKPELAAAAES